MVKTVNIISDIKSRNFKTVNVVTSGDTRWKTVNNLSVPNNVVETVQDSGGTIAGLETLICPGYSPGGYVASAVNFDNGGVAQFIPDFAAAAIVSPTDPTDMLLAGWFGQCVGNGPNFGSVGNFGGIGYAFIDNGSGGITAQCIGFSENGLLFTIHSIQIASDPTLWHSFAISVVPATNTFQLLVDRVLIDTSGITWSGTDPIGFHNGDPWDLGFDNLAIGSFSVSDTRIGANEGFFDLSVNSNVDKLFSASNKPISWGINGNLVTGSIPMIFLTGDASTYQNAGNGGAFTLTGTLTNAATHP